MFATSLAAVMITGLACQNYPPEVPADLSGPTYCFRDTTQTFKTIVTDPDGDKVAARIDWGDAVITDWTSAVPSGDTITLAHAWRDTGTFQVSVQAIDDGQQRSGWSNALAVRVVLRRPPNMPDVLTGPERGGQDSSYTFATSASHPDSITVAIRFAWGDGDTTDWSAFVAFGQAVTDSHAWTVPDTYDVTAQARDTGSGRSAWSLPHSIIIKSPDTLRIWRLRLADSASTMSSSPAIGTDGTVYVGSSDGSLYAVNPDGTIKWRFLTGGSIEASPLIAPVGFVYFGSNDSAVYALTPEGKLVWRYATRGSVRSSPAIAADGTVFVGSHDDRLYAFNLDGTPKWSYLTGSNVTSSPAISSDGTVYVGSYDDYLYAINPDGTLKWRYDVGHNFNRASAAIGADGTVFCGAEENSFSQSFYAFDQAGALKWSYSTRGDVRSSPAIAGDGTVYVGSGHYLSALNPDGTLKWSYQTEGSVEAAPTIASDGTVYFTSADGYLYALKGTGPLADSPWPKFHHDLKNTGRVGGGR
jgi:outer membrane protein assembly factor BamB